MVRTALVFYFILLFLSTFRYQGIKAS